MEKVKKKFEMPTASICPTNFGTIDYWDFFQVTRNTEYSVDKFTTEIFETPKWVNALMKIRNRIVKPFGLKGDDMRSVEPDNNYEIGSKGSYFTVIDRNENEIVFGENDRHLNFRASVMIERDDDKTRIFLTTIVKFNNIWGKIYFIPVKPFHKIIMRALLRRIKK